MTDFVGNVGTIYEVARMGTKGRTEETEMDGSLGPEGSVPIHRCPLTFREGIHLSRI